MKDILGQQIKNLEMQEGKLMNQPENPLMKATITPVMDKIQSLIPPKLKSALNTAFFKGFELIFEKGSPYIEKTYNKDKLETEYDINNYAIDKKANKRHMIRMDKQSVQSKLLNTSFSTLEGGVLGFLGVGIPDIPIFLSVVVRTVYEVALSYGFGYSTEDEKSYILLLICGAMSKGEKQKEFNMQLEKLGASIDQNIVSGVTFEEQMRITSDVFSDALLTAKFIQGIPIVGAVGGVVNFNIINKISHYARIKYKKRYLNKKKKSSEDLN